MANPAAKGRYRNLNIQALALLLGDAKPANRLKVPLSRRDDAEDEENADMSIQIDDGQAPLVARLLKARADEAAIIAALAETPEDEREGVVHAMRLLEGVKPEAVHAALSAVGWAIKPIDGDVPPKPDPRLPPEAAKAVAAARAEAEAQIQAARKEAAEALALANAVQAERELETLTALARTELGRVPGANPGERARVLQRAKANLSAEDYGAILGWMRAANAVCAESKLLGSFGRDGEGEAATGEVALKALATARTEKDKIPYAKALALVLDTPEGKRHYAEAAQERGA